MVLATSLAIGCSESGDEKTYAPGDGGTSADAGGDGQADGDAPAAGRLYSFVSVERWTREGVANTMGGLPTFHQESPPPYVTSIDPYCIVHEEGWAENGGTPPSYGVVTIDGLPGGSVVWSDGPEGPGFDVTPDGFDVGDTLTVHSTGAEIPAFSFTATVPGVPALTSHDNTVPGPGVISIDRSKSFELTWTPVDGEVFALLLQWTPVEFRMLHGIQCFFPGKDGAGAIPVGALKRLLPSAEVQQTNFYFARVHRERAELPSIDVDFILWNGRMTRVGVN